MRKMFMFLVLVIAIFMVVGCARKIAEVESLRINNFPEGEFVEGQDNISLSGVTVDVEYLDGSTETLSLSDVTITGNGLVGQSLDLSSAGKFYIQVSYGGVTVRVNYVVRATAWADEAVTDWFTGDGPYTITTAEQLAGLAKLVNEGTEDFYGKVVELGADIDLLYGIWIPIGWRTTDPGSAGNDGEAFKGTFDGKGFTISNLYVNTPYISYVGLFGYVSDATLKDLNIEGAQVLGYEHGAALVGSASTGIMIENVHVKDAYIEVSHWSGAILGYASTVAGTIKHSSAEDITLVAPVLDAQANGDKIGGIAGYVVNFYIEDNSVNNIDITAFRDAGGIVSMSNNLERVTDNTATNVILRLDKNQIENPNFHDGEKSLNRWVGAIVGRTGASTDPNTIGAGNSWNNVRTYIRIEDTNVYREYQTKTVGAHLQASYVLID